MILYILVKYETNIGKIDSNSKENSQSKLGIVNA